MSEKKSYQQLAEEIEPYNKYIGRSILHVKSQTYYIVKDVFYKEDDMSIWFSYFPAATVYNVKFSRPIGELTDGRFSF